MCRGRGESASACLSYCTQNTRESKSGAALADALRKLDRGRRLKVAEALLEAGEQENARTP